MELLAPFKGFLERTMHVLDLKAFNVEVMRSSNAFSSQ